MACEDLETDLPQIAEACVAEWFDPSAIKKAKRSWHKYVALWMAKKYSPTSATIEPYLDKEYVEQVVSKYLAQELFSKIHTGDEDVALDRFAYLDGNVVFQVAKEVAHLSKADSEAATTAILQQRIDDLESQLQQERTTVAELKQQSAFLEKKAEWDLRTATEAFSTEQYQHEATKRALNDDGSETEAFPTEQHDDDDDFNALLLDHGIDPSDVFD